LCVTLVIYQESLKDARSTNYEIVLGVAKPADKITFGLKKIGVGHESVDWIGLGFIGLKLNKILVFAQKVQSLGFEKAINIIPR